MPTRRVAVWWKEDGHKTDNPRIQYEYDGYQNLVGVTDRSGATTQFVYFDDPDHYLDQILDPLGRTAASTSYDSQGRVETVTDVDGQTITYSYSVAGKTHSITDQLGYTVEETLDGRGNVLEEHNVDTGALTLGTYDDEDHLLTETIVVGLEDTQSSETNDLTATYEYDPTSGDLVETIDSRGRGQTPRIQSRTYPPVLCGAKIFNNA